MSAQKNDVKVISIKEFARMVGFSDTIIRRRMAEGKITKNSIFTRPTGQPALLIPHALDDWKRFNFEIKGTAAPEGYVQESILVKSVKKESKTKQIPVIDVFVEDMAKAVFDANNEDEPYKSMSLADINKRKEYFAAEKNRVHVEETMGILVRRDVVERELFSLGQTLRQELKSLPAKISAFMTGNKLKDQNILDTEIDKCLTRFIDQQTRIFKKKQESKEVEDEL